MLEECDEVLECCAWEILQSGVEVFVSESDLISPGEFGRD